MGARPHFLPPLAFSTPPPSTRGSLVSEAAILLRSISLHKVLRICRMSEHDAVVILGAGVIGLCSAFYLVEKGARVVLVDNAQEVAQGASGYAGGFIGTTGWHGPDVEPLARLSWREHVRLAKLLDGENEYGFRECAALGVRIGEASLRRSAYRRLPTHGAHSTHVDWLNGDDQEDLTGNGGVGQVDPDLFCHALLAYVKSKGATIIYGEPLALGDGLLSIKAQNGLRQDVPYSRVLVSAGPWSSALCEKLALSPVPIESLPGHSLLIRPREQKKLPAESVFAGISSDWGVHASILSSGALSEADQEEGFTRSPELFCRPSGLVYVAGENTPSQHGGLPPTVGQVKAQLDQKLVRRLARSAALVSADLDVGKGAVIEREQVC